MTERTDAALRALSFARTTGATDEETVRLVLDTADEVSRLRVFDAAMAETGQAEAPTERFSAEAVFDGGVTLRVNPSHGCMTPPHDDGCPPGCSRDVVHFYDPSRRGRERTMLWPTDADALALAEALVPDGYTVRDALSARREDEVVAWAWAAHGDTNVTTDAGLADRVAASGADVHALAYAGPRSATPTHHKDMESTQ